jgi:quercetin dioxygenase-like cupin family protein
MQLRKYRWSKHYESAEEELHRFLQGKRIKAERWEAEAGHEFEPHSHDFDKHLYCAEGSISLTANGRTFSLQPGDGLDLPANTIHHARTGLAGVVCYEAHTQPVNIGR